MGRVFRIFLNPLGSQERYLNKKAARGWRLERTLGPFLWFTPCAPGAYMYAVDFVADKSWEEIRAYKAFMEEMGYRAMHRVFYPTVKLGVTFRPWARGKGKIATSPGAYTKELMILEKPGDGQPFQLRTEPGDLLAYYRVLRNMVAWAAGVLLAVGLLFGGYLIPGLVIWPITYVLLYITLLNHQRVRGLVKEAEIYGG